MSGDRTRPPQAKGPPSISAPAERHSACAGARAASTFGLLRHLDIRLLAASVLTVVPTV